jgi:hypothetical protein
MSGHKGISLYTFAQQELIEADDKKPFSRFELPRGFCSIFGWLLRRFYSAADRP